MSQLRKRGRSLTVQETDSVHGPVTSITTSKHSAVNSLRLYVVSAFFIAMIVHMSLTLLQLLTQRRDLTFRNPKKSYEKSYLSSPPARQISQRNIVYDNFQVPVHHKEVKIRENDEQEHSQWRREFLESIDEEMKERFDPGKEASFRRIHWDRAVHSTCHAFHEISMERELLNGKIGYLGSGTYRDAWILREENVVYKTTILTDPKVDDKQSTQIFTDANTMKAFAFPDRITHIYGYCGTSVMTESLKDTTEIRVK